MTVLRHSLGIVLFAAFAAPAAAAEPTDVDGVVVSAVEARVVSPIFGKQAPNNVKKYGPAGLYIPEKATRGREVIPGQVALRCTLVATGRLNDCAVLSESSPDIPFGLAALRLAQVGMVTAAPLVVDGQPLASEAVRIVIPFGPQRPTS